MFHSLTDFQKQLIQEYKKLATEVYFHGIDENALPVISFKDSNGVREPFAILNRPRRTMSVYDVLGKGAIPARTVIPVERTTNEVAYPVRDLTSDELDNMDLRSYELIAGLLKRD